MHWRAINVVTGNYITNALEILGGGSKNSRALIKRMRGHDWICPLVQWKTGWLVRYIYHFSLLLPSAHATFLHALKLSASSDPPGAGTWDAHSLVARAMPPKDPPKWGGFPKQNPLKAERRIFSSRNWSPAHVSAADTWDVRALHLSHSTIKVSSPRGHLQAYLVQSNKISSSLGHHKTHSVLCPDYPTPLY